ncbi:MAG: hypothetical protein VXZ82_09845 [Planctomycetota bacterium]|nr:hypothetical protein [Planctomycetota bacterium]
MQEMPDQDLDSIPEAGLQLLESTELNGSMCVEATDAIVQYAEAKTRATLFLEPNESTDSS